MKRALLAIAMLLVSCGAPPGPQGEPAVPVETWGPASLLTFDPAAGLTADDAQAALDEVTARADAIGATAVANRDPFCGRAFGSGGGNWSGYTGAISACESAGGACAGILGIHPCSTDDLARSRSAGTVLGDVGWVFDPLACRGMTVNSAGERGLIWAPAVGFSVTSCDDPSNALMCCG